MMMFALSFAHAACDRRVEVAEIEAEIARAEVAIQTLDAPTLQSAVGAADAALPCLAQPLGSVHLARWYRARAILRFVSGDPAQATELFRAARALQPAYQLDPELGVPILEAYAAAVPAADSRALPRPAEGWVVVDGRSLPTAPADRPFVVQWFAADGAVRATTLLHPGEELPYPPAPAETASVLPAPVVINVPPPAPPPLPEGHVSRTLAVSGIGAGLLAGAGIAVAASMRETVVTSEEPFSADDPLVVANRAVGWSAAVAGVAAIGLGVGAVVVGQW